MDAGISLRYPVYDSNRVLLLKAGAVVDDHLRELLTRRNVHLEVYATLAMAGKGRHIEVAVGALPIVFGRGYECQIRPTSARVSKRHCSIERVEYTLYVTDLASRNGTFHNGVRIDDKVVLGDGDRLDVADVRVLVHVFAAMRGNYGKTAHDIVLLSDDRADPECSTHPGRILPLGMSLPPRSVRDGK